MKHIIDKLIASNKTIATMESCTGGGLANAITNVEGSSEVFMFGAVTYSNDYKIKLGVSKDVIDEYSVYSMETSVSMAKSISNYAKSNYGVGITGKLKRKDKNNLNGSDNLVFVTIYNKDTDNLDSFSIEVTEYSRDKNKDIVIEEVIKHLNNIIK